MRFLTPYFIAILAGWTTAFADSVEDYIQTCPTLKKCILDLENKPNSFLKDKIRTAQYVEILKERFGTEAYKAGLIELSQNSQTNSDHVLFLLRYVKEWDESDYPLLRQLLRDTKNLHVLRILKAIDTEESVRILFEEYYSKNNFHSKLWLLEIPQHDNEYIDNQVPSYKSPSAKNVLSVILPFLEGPFYYDPDSLLEEFRVKGYNNLSPEELDELLKVFHELQDVNGRIEDFQDYIRRTGLAARDFEIDWIKIALNDKNELEKRLAALRALAGMEYNISEDLDILLLLKRHSNQRLRDEVKLTLRKTRHPSAAQAIAEECNAIGDSQTPPKTARHYDYLFCLMELAEFGSKGKHVAQKIRPLLGHKNPDVQFWAIITIGVLGDADLIEDLKPFLNSKDWRVVFATIRSLRYLGDNSSLERVNAISNNHWLYDLRKFAEKTTFQIRTNSPLLETYMPQKIIRHHAELDLFYIELDLKYDSCPSDLWGSFWEKPVDFNNHKNPYPSLTLEFNDGKIIGINNGEFGGELRWSPNEGESTILVDDNVDYIIPTKNGFLSIHGMRHLTTHEGYLYSHVRNTDGTFSSTREFQFPGWIHKIKKLDNGDFVAKSGGRVVIFNENDIKLELECNIRPSLAAPI